LRGYEVHFRECTGKKAQSSIAGSTRSTGQKISYGSKSMLTYQKTKP
jgi:hypothetical protein